MSNKDVLVAVGVMTPEASALGRYLVKSSMGHSAHDAIYAAAILVAFICTVQTDVLKDEVLDVLETIVNLELEKRSLVTTSPHEAAE